MACTLILCACVMKHDKNLFPRSFSGWVSTWRCAGGPLWDSMKAIITPLPSSLPCVSFIGLTLSYNLHSKLVNSKYNAFMSSVSHSRELLNLNWGHRNPWICSWLGRIVGSLGTLVWLVWSEGTCGACIDSRINVKLNWIVRHSVGAGELLWKMIGIWCQTHTHTFSVESGVRRQRTESFFPSAALGPGFLEGYVSPWILHWEGASATFTGHISSLRTCCHR